MLYWDSRSISSYYTICEVHGYSGLFAARSDVKIFSPMSVSLTIFSVFNTGWFCFQADVREHDARWVAWGNTTRVVHVISTLLSMSLSSANATLEKSKMKKDLDSLKSHVLEVERFVLPFQKKGILICYVFDNADYREIGWMIAFFSRRHGFP